MADAQQSINNMRERLRIVDEKHDAAVMERGQAALHYAVSHTKMTKFYMLSTGHRMPLRIYESCIMTFMKLKSC